MTYSRASRWRRILFAVALTLPLCFPAPVMAAGAGGAGTLTLQCHFEHEEGEFHYMTGDSFGVYRIMDARQEPVDPLFGETGDWYVLDDSGRKAKALELALLVKQGNVKPMYTMELGGDGTDSESVEPGFYLVVRETVAPANGEYEMDPFLFGFVTPDDIVITPKYSYDSDGGGGGGGGGGTGGGRDRDPRPGRDRPRSGATRTAPGDPGQSTVTVETPTTPLVQLPPGTTPLEQKPLPQTGQLRWPIPILIVAGVMFFITGFDLRYGERRQDEEK